MKQVALDLRNGKISLLDCPDPLAGNGELVIAASCTLVSPGTERMLLNFGSGNWLSKARQQPEKLKQTFRKIKTDGLTATFKAVQSKLSEPMPLGYSHVGRVVAVGAGVSGFAIGDRVVSNGAHAGVVAVPKNLCAKIPENVTDEAAAFTVPAAIALQSIRLANPTFMETVVVIGAGLIGQLTARLLLANGCRVFVTDRQEKRLELLPEGITGSSSTGQLTDAFQEVDAVIITAATNDASLINQCAEICRKRGRIILSGVAPIQIDRSLLYQKEIYFQVSCSYGPGRYDPAYEQKGMDYPLGFVRWTAQRNFEAVLEAMRQGRLPVENLISLQARISEAATVYAQLQQPGSDLLTALFTYPDYVLATPHVPLEQASFIPSQGKQLGVIGAGQFTGSVLLPVLKALKAPVKIISGKGGFHAAALAKKFGIPSTVTGIDSLLQDPETGLVLITTPHQHHATMAVKFMQAGKDVFLEKPMAIDRDGLNAIIAERIKSRRLLYVGYNRRFAPLAKAAKDTWQELHQPPFMIYHINAGRLPQNHWLHQEESGGRLVGEVCHFIDFCVFIQGALVKSVFAKEDHAKDVSIIVSFKNNAQAVIHYFSNGNSNCSKERIELHGAGRSLIIDNWRHLKGYGVSSTGSMFSKQDKGHKAQFAALLREWADGKELIPFEELVNVASATLAVKESLASGKEILLD